MENEEKCVVLEEMVSLENIELYRQKKIVEYLLEGETLMEFDLVERAERQFKHAASYEDYSVKMLAGLLISEAVSNFLYDERGAKNND